MHTHVYMYMYSCTCLHKSIFSSFGHAPLTCTLYMMLRDFLENCEKLAATLCTEVCVYVSNSLAVDHDNGLLAYMYMYLLLYLYMYMNNHVHSAPQ